MSASIASPYPPALDIYIEHELYELIGCAGMRPLRVRNISHLGDLVAQSEASLMAMEDLGLARVHKIKNWVESKGLQLGKPDEAWLQMVREARARLDMIPLEQRFSSEQSSPEAIRRYDDACRARYAQIKSRGNDPH